MAFRFLIVEDDAELREIITDYFHEKSQGEIIIDSAENGSLGQDKCMDNEYDAVLLDVMLPEVNGYSICRELRRKSDVPIVFLTARNTEGDILKGYQLGCDDYISKPFSLAELYAKLNALVRRAKGTVRNELITAGMISLNPYRYTVFVNTEEITLAPLEFALLKVLMENKGRLIDRDTLIIKVWGYDFDGNDRVVDNHIKKLRKALKDGACQIKTVIKKGYMLGE